MLVLSSLEMCISAMDTHGDEALGLSAGLDGEEDVSQPLQESAGPSILQAADGGGSSQQGEQANTQLAVQHGPALQEAAMSSLSMTALSPAPAKLQTYLADVVTQMPAIRSATPPHPCNGRTG